MPLKVSRFRDIYAIQETGEPTLWVPDDPGNRDYRRFVKPLVDRGRPIPEMPERPDPSAPEPPGLLEVVRGLDDLFALLIAPHQIPDSTREMLNKVRRIDNRAEL